MISLVQWVEIISAVLKFPDAVLRLVQALKQTPEEQHEGLVKQAEDEAHKMASGQRPSWD